MAQVNLDELAYLIRRAKAKQRLESGLTQEQVAEMLGTGNEAVSRMERGPVMPTVARLVAPYRNRSASWAVSTLISGHSLPYSQSGRYVLINSRLRILSGTLVQPRARYGGPLTVSAAAPETPLSHAPRRAVLSTDS